jgi:hypothetical protein
LKGKRSYQQKKQNHGIRKNQSILFEAREHFTSSISNHGRKGRRSFDLQSFGQRSVEGQITQRRFLKSVLVKPPCSGGFLFYGGKYETNHSSIFETCDFSTQNQK